MSRAPFTDAEAEAAMLDLINMKDAEIGRLIEENERLRDALYPFAECATAYLPEEPSDEATHPWGDDVPFIADLHRARRAYEGTSLLQSAPGGSGKED